MLDLSLYSIILVGEDRKVKLGEAGKEYWQW